VVSARDLFQSPLHDRHVDAGAKMADFGGWWMPIEYPGGGVVAEHTAVRERVGIFDVSHLGKAAIGGEGARDFVNRCLTNDLGRIGARQAQYTLCCDDPTGGVVDDMIAYLYGDDEVFLVPNAANTAEVVARLAAAAPEHIDVDDLHRRFGVLAVQGPRSAELLADLDVPTDYDYMSFVDSDWAGRPLLVGRTGYTGERGYELLARWDDTGPLWDALTEAGSSYGALPCGLGARDTLRTEMGYPLHGQDLTLDVTPVQGRSSWAVGWDKPAFWGREVLTRQRADKPARRLLGLRAVDRGIPRPQMTVTAQDGEVGVVTSGTFSPTLRTGIGLALLDRAVSAGDEVSVDIRGRAATMVVVKPPFVAASPK
jgi:aminomethyltransferase